MSGAVSTRDFGTREDEPITDLEEAGPGATRDTHTAMGLFKGMVQRLGEMLDGMSGWFDPATTLTTGQVALSTTAKLVLAAGLSNRKFCEVRNTDAAINIYIGDDAGVSSANGYLLRPGETFGFELYSGAVWAIAASGTPTIAAIEW